MTEPRANASGLAADHADSPSFTSSSFYERPYIWTWFAIIMFMVPAAAYALQRELAFVDIHPALNAVLNATSGIFLVVGLVAIRQHNVKLHRLCMITAFSTSTLFLFSYLTRYALTGTHHYPGTGIDKIAYLLILFSHMIAAVVLVPLVLVTLVRARRKDFDRHSKIARWTWPIWMYTSVTGVIVYLMLYPIASSLYP